VYLRRNKNTTGKSFTFTERLPLSTLAKTTTNDRNRTAMKNIQSFKRKRKYITGANLKKKQEGTELIF